MNTYDIPPFSGPKYRENERKVPDGDVPCAICGKAVIKPWKFTAVVVNGGDWARTEAEEKNETDPGYMGSWPIGAACHRKHLVRTAA